MADLKRNNGERRRPKIPISNDDNDNDGLMSSSDGQLQIQDTAGHVRVDRLLYRYLTCLIHCPMIGYHLKCSI